VYSAALLLAQAILQQPLFSYYFGLLVDCLLDLSSTCRRCLLLDKTNIASFLFVHSCINNPALDILNPVRVISPLHYPLIEPNKFPGIHSWMSSIYGKGTIYPALYLVAELQALRPCSVVSKALKPSQG
jgi:hypothetical protein